MVDRRLEEVESLVVEAERESEPAKRLQSFLQVHDERADDLALYGCPFSCLAQEFERMGGSLGRRSARLLERQCSWMKRQFVAMGHAPDQADSLSLELLSALHGAMVVGHSFGSADIMRTRFQALAVWIDERAAQVG